MTEESSQDSTEKDVNSQTELNSSDNISISDIEFEVNGTTAGESSGEDVVLDEVQTFSRIMELEEEVKVEQEKYLRLLAEFDNYKKQVAKQRSEMLKYQGQEVFFDLVQVVDNFELSVAHADADYDSFRQGIELIHKQFKDILAKWQVVSESSVGSAFNPKVHNAIASEPSEEYEPGTVLKELKRQVHYKDRLLRPAEVIISAQASEQSEE